MGWAKSSASIWAEQIASLPVDQPRVLVDTGRYRGEGFDDERLDTLFLDLPISWRGTVTHAQRVGRLHRLNAAKNEVIIYDYVDCEVPLLAKTYARRRTGYYAMGYQIHMPGNKSQAGQMVLESL